MIQMTQITLNQAFPNGLLGEGIFENMIDPPWSDMFTADDLDLQFFAEHGEKLASPIVSKFYVEPTGLTEEVRTRLSNIILKRFMKQWEQKFALLFVTYNPIENYKMVEQGTDRDTGTDTDAATNTETATDTTQSTGTGSSNNTNNTTNGVYGFNSTDSVNSDIISGTGTETNTTESTDTRTSNINRTNENTKTLNLTHSHEFTRSGNIGVTTSQQMIQSEIDLWKWNFLTDVFNDIASVLALSIYKIEI